MSHTYVEFPKGVEWCRMRCKGDQLVDKDVMEQKKMCCTTNSAVRVHSIKSKN